jgi:hypothetical protein
MKLVIEIALDNDVFQGDYGDAGAEVARILEAYAERLHCGGEFTHTALRDLNGNPVGSARLVE